MRARTALLLALLGPALAAWPLAAQDVAVRLREQGASEAYVQRVKTLVDAASLAGLPAEPLIAKALEGWAKRDQVALDSVLTVLATLRARLDTSRAILLTAGFTPDADAVIAGTQAMGRGLTPADVRLVVTAATTPERARDGLVAVARLAAWSIPPAIAVGAVRDALWRGTSLDDLVREATPDTAIH